ncbi:hypothetical protein GGX14DRAFT_600390 [Mycena pura]|uniref:Uncharacterized protein n=1 Tax=Mycena pura TaxID=153505 RepID=A0AAD6URZ9_9AGAR|nr:hypothetical protein GGX14DRAFT_600390 [Mycena pura]
MSVLPAPLWDETRTGQGDALRASSSTSPSSILFRPFLPRARARRRPPPALPPVLLNSILIDRRVKIAPIAPPAAVRCPPNLPKSLLHGRASGWDDDGNGNIVMDVFLARTRSRSWGLGVHFDTWIMRARRCCIAPHPARRSHFSSVAPRVLFGRWDACGSDVWQRVGGYAASSGAPALLSRKWCSVSSRSSCSGCSRRRRCTARSRRRSLKSFIGDIMPRHLPSPGPAPGFRTPVPALLAFPRAHRGGGDGDGRAVSATLNSTGLAMPDPESTGIAAPDTAVVATPPQAVPSPSLSRDSPASCA